MTNEEVLECYAAGRLTLEAAMEWIRIDRESAVMAAKIEYIDGLLAYIESKP